MRFGERRLQPGGDENAARTGRVVVAADFLAPDIEVRSVVGGLDGKIRGCRREPLGRTGVRLGGRAGAEREGDRQACAEEVASPSRQAARAISGRYPLQELTDGSPSHCFNAKLNCCTPLGVVMSTKYGVGFAGRAEIARH